MTNSEFNARLSDAASALSALITKGWEGNHGASPEVLEALRLVGGPSPRAAAMEWRMHPESFLEALYRIAFSLSRLWDEAAYHTPPRGQAWEQLRAVRRAAGLLHEEANYPGRW